MNKCFVPLLVFTLVFQVSNASVKDELDPSKLIGSNAFTTVSFEIKSSSLNAHFLKKGKN